MPGPLSVRQAWEEGRGKEEMSARSFESLPRVLSYQFTLESVFLWSIRLRAGVQATCLSPEAGPGSPFPVGITSERLGIFNQGTRCIEKHVATLNMLHMTA